LDLLIVDDDYELSSALARVGETYFDEVKSVSTAPEALSMIDHHNPGVILTDWDLHEHITGVDVLNYACEVSPESRLAMITGKSIAKLLELTEHLAVEYYIEKPFTISELRTVLHALSK